MTSYDEITIKVSPDNFFDVSPEYGSCSETYKSDVLVENWQFTTQQVHITHRAEILPILTNLILI